MAILRQQAEDRRCRLLRGTEGCDRRQRKEAVPTTTAIARSGWERFPRPALAAEPNNFISNWTCCNTYGSKRGANC